MKKAFEYRVSPRSPFVMLAFLCCLASFAFRVWYIADFPRPFPFAFLLFNCILPLFAVVLYGIFALRKSKKCAITAFPYLLFALYAVLRAVHLFKGYRLWIAVGICVILSLLSVKTVRNRVAGKTPLLLLHFALLSLFLYCLFNTEHNIDHVAVASFAGMLLGVIFYLLSLHKCELEQRFRRRGDRSDGRRIRSKPPMDNIAPYIMVSKIGAANMFRDEFEIAKPEKYILQKRKEGWKSFGLMHVLIAAYVRMISEKPAVNRFIAGQRLYARDDLIEINLTIKKEMTEAAPETVVKFTFNPRMTAKEVYDIVKGEVDQNKSDKLDADMDSGAAILNYIPGVVLKFIMWLLKLLDYFGLLPRALTKVSPFHGSMFITSMGSLGVPPVNHHLYDFGNLPIFIAFGPKKKRYTLESDGSIREKRYCEFTATVDDRICDGYTYAQAFKVMKKYVSNPYLLDTPPEKVTYDID
ncbi:MAG: 2-oxo acid dehydrogenase subunit E2 [Clostridia bacterium]|nr:2-oxo acid dehydrogenase subunit E2 [Clostridia bacterium]